MYNGHADKVNCEAREGALGHVTALIDSSGNILATYYYDAFGNIVAQTGTFNNNVTYAGYQYDKETGKYYLMARFYDPIIARFMQEDTYRGDKNDPLSLNLYTYCHNEPLMYWDYDGHTYWDYDKVQKVGSSNNDVVLIQKQLEALGYLTMPTDSNGNKVSYGYYGELTQKAVKKYQQDQYNTGNYGWLTKKGIDGIVGRGTWALLGLDKPVEERNKLSLGKGPISDEYAAKLTYGSASDSDLMSNFNRMLNEEYEIVDHSNSTTVYESAPTTGEKIKQGLEALDQASTALMINDPIPNSGYPATYADNALALAGKGVSKFGLFTIEAVTKGDDITKVTTKTVQTTRVGQWMSKTEYEQFVKTGEIPRTNVLAKGKEGFIKQANAGDYYVEFDVDSSLLFTKNEELGWALVKSKNPWFLKLAEKKGTTLPDPIGWNITHITTK